MVATHTHKHPNLQPNLPHNVQMMHGEDPWASIPPKRCAWLCSGEGAPYQSYGPLCEKQGFADPRFLLEVGGSPLEGQHCSPRLIEDQELAEPAMGHHPQRRVAPCCLVSESQGARHAALVGKLSEGCLTAIERPPVGPLATSRSNARHPHRLPHHGNGRRASATLQIAARLSRIDKATARPSKQEHVTPF